MDSPSDTKGLGWLQERFRLAESAREPHELQWRLNLSWLIGRQNTIIHQMSRKVLEDRDAPSWRVRLIANRILPIWRSQLGRLLKNRPIPDAIPSTGDEDDVLTARVADKLLKHIWGESEMDAQGAIQLYAWLLSCGSGFALPWFNHDTGDHVDRPEMLEAEEVLESPDNAIQRMGEIEIDVVSPFEIYPDPSAVDWKTMRWMFRVKSLPVEELRVMYPKYKDKIQPESGLEAVEWPFDPALSSPTLPYARDNRNHMKDLARVKEYFERPSPKHSNGYHAVMLSGEILVEEEEKDKLPYDHKEIPGAKFDYIYVPGRFWGMSLIEHLIPLQREYNRTRSQIIEAKNMMSKPKLMVPVTAGVAQDAWTTEPGEKVYYNPHGGKPEPYVPPPIPAYVLQELERTEQDMMEVASHHYAMRGMNPPGVRTAAGLSLLQEADDTPQGPVLTWNEKSWREVGMQVVELAKQFYLEPRIVYMRLGNEAEAVEFSREKLKGRYRIRVDMGSSLPLSRAARMQFALELLDRGAFRKTPQEGGGIDEARFFQFLEMESALDIFRDDQIDIRVARTENVEMRDKFEHYDAGLYDKHQIHLEHHIRFMKELHLEHPEHKAIQLLAQHIGSHEQRLQELQIKQGEEQITVQAAIEGIKAKLAPTPPVGPANQQQPPQAQPPSEAAGGPAAPTPPGTNAPAPPQGPESPLG